MVCDRTVGVVHRRGRGRTGQGVGSWCPGRGVEPERVWGRGARDMGTDRRGCEVGS